MREGTPSRTAAFVAVMRGLGRFLPPSLQLAHDPYGTAFGGASLRWLTDQATIGSGRAVIGLPSIRNWVLYMQVRTRVLDDIVRTFVQQGGTQVVILGAGYDCRALRLRELRDAAVFEIDHPDTQRHKRSVLTALGAVSAARYLPWDFEHRPVDTIPKALADLGHNPNLPTLTVWEGVTMYLTEQAIDASARAVAQYSAEGSLFAMTYHIEQDMPADSLRRRTLGALVTRIGEPWRWAWARGAVAGWAEAHGFTVERDVSSGDVALGLLPPQLVTGWWPGATAVLRRTS